MRKLALALLMAAAPIAAANAQSMPVSTFLAKADALEKRGAMALFSKEIGLLKKEVQRSATIVRAEQVAARKAGRKPSTCMPDKVQLNSKELLDYLRSIPPAQRGMPIQAAFAGMMRRQYPCPA